MRDLILPRVYDNPHNNPKFEKYVGMPKVSYSQITSFQDETYKGGYIAGYLFGVRDEGNIFTEFGTWVGEYMEKGEDLYGKLTESDIAACEEVGRPDNCEYEREIVIESPLGYVIQGYIDRTRFLSEKDVEVIDFKTGSIKTKEAKYAGPDYNQTTLYTQALINEGFNVVHSGVILFDRKGNGREKHPLRLTGEVANIDTPYTKERFDKFMKKADKTVLEIAEYLRIANKYLK
mgnify:CR=1 FL=1